MTTPDNHNIAVFCDAEHVAFGTKVASATARAVRRKGKPAAEEAATVPNPGAESKKGRAIDSVARTVEQMVSDQGSAGSIMAATIIGTLQRVQPAFSESEYGNSVFGKIPDDARKRGAPMADRRESGIAMVSLPPSRA
jgi:hypothetical protein